MPHVSIPDELFCRLAQRAAALNVTVEQLVAPLLDKAAECDVPSAGVQRDGSFGSWKAVFDAWMVEVEERASRYQAGFRMDDSRESVYQSCGE